MCSSDLGLIVNMVLPLCFGLPVVLHPNPTEAARLDRICRRWRPSITVAPPSFLDAMLQKAEAGDFESLWLGVVGAEACPARLHATFAEKTSLRPENRQWWHRPPEWLLRESGGSHG